jgi:hypothetical protein
MNAAMAKTSNAATTMRRFREGFLMVFMPWVWREFQFDPFAAG